MTTEQIPQGIGAGSAQLEAERKAVQDAQKDAPQDDSAKTKKEEKK